MKRSELAENIIRTIHKGKNFQSTVHLVHWQSDGFREAAIKDFSGTPKFFRTFVAPLLIAREIKVLRWLDGAPGIPKYLGRIDRYAFAMQFIEGTPISNFHKGELGQETFDKIQTAIDAMHARGVAHGDIKRRSNLIMDKQGEIWIIDFAASIIGRNPLTKKLMDMLSEVDNKSVPRLKKFVAPELMTEEDKFKMSNPTTLERWGKKLFKR
jgi:RIO-like serine/threonine protein kinase